MKKYSITEIKHRRMLRLAELIHDHWIEGSGMDTRHFELPLIHDSLVEYGDSSKGGNYREHAVPRIVLRDECLQMYSASATVEEVASALMKNLWIVRITNEEARHLDNSLGLKTRMPEGWKFGVDDPFSRFHVAGISVFRNGDLVINNELDSEAKQ
jgi:hypothetical protein